MQLDFDYARARADGYSDDDILNGLQKAGKINFDLAAARKDGYSSSDILSTIIAKPVAPVKPEETSLLRRAGDIGISALKGAIGVPEAAVGLADIVSGGAAGRAAESVGFRPKEAKAILNEYLSPAQQAANKRVSDAQGFIDTGVAALQNPSVILQTGVESLPAMGAGGLIGRGVAAVSKVAPYVAGAIGEGVVGAGAAAEGIRQNTADGRLSAAQSGAALASGAGTALFGAVGGRIAKKLGIEDIDTALVQAGATTTSKGVTRRLIEGGISEGVFEELPQSIQEQIWQNAALDRPLMEGVPESAAMGLLTGAAMGGVAGAALRGSPPVAPITQEETAPVTPPSAPPLLLGNTPDPLISFPDGSVGRQADVDNFINTLPEETRVEARARLYGQAPQEITPADILQQQSVDEAIAVTEQAIAQDTPQAREQKNADIDAAWKAYEAQATAQRQAEFSAAEEARRVADLPQMQAELQDQNVAQATALSNAQGFGESVPTNMQRAMQQAMNLRAQANAAAAQRRLGGEQDAAYAARNAEISAQRQQQFDLAADARNRADSVDAQIQAAQQSLDLGNAISSEMGLPERQPSAMQLAFQQAKGRRAPTASQRAILPAQQTTGEENGQVARINQDTPVVDAGSGSASGSADDRYTAPGSITLDAIPAASIRRNAGRPNTVSGLWDDETISARVLQGSGSAAALPNDSPRSGGAGIAPVSVAETPSVQVSQAAQQQSTQAQVDSSVKQASAILTAAGVKGNERMEALRNIRSGVNTLDDLIEAHPPKEQDAIAQPGAGPVRNDGAVGNQAVAQDRPVTETGSADTAQPDAVGAAISDQVQQSAENGVADAVEAREPAAALSDVAGEKIDSEWTSFAEKSGTLNIDRAEMPQVKAAHRGALVNYLNARGIAHETTEVPAGDLKPTQREFSNKKVQQARDYQGGDRSILISSDNHVLDGHHQWLSKLESGEPVKVIRLDAPIRELLEPVKEFPSSQVSEGAATESAAPARELTPIQAEAERARRPKSERAATAQSAETKANEPGAVTERYLGRYGKGMSGANARTEAAMRNKKDTGTTWTAEPNEELGYDKFEVVGRKTDAAPRKSESAASSGMLAADVNKAITMLRAKWMGFTKVNTVQSVEDLPADIRERSGADAQTEGLYDPKTKAVYLIADNIASPARGAWVASHEVVGHGGLRMLRDKTLNEALNLVGANRFVSDLATKIKVERDAQAKLVAKDAGKDFLYEDEMPKNIATEEAVAELSAAIETDGFADLADRYGVDVPSSAMNGIRGIVARAYEAVKRFLASAIGKPLSSVSDADVRALVGEQQAGVGGRQAPVSESELKSQMDDFAAEKVRASETGMVDLYHGSNKGFSAITDSGLFGGIFASANKDAALSHGDILHTMRLKKSEIMTQSDIEDVSDQDIKKVARWIEEDDMERARELIVDDEAAQDDDARIMRVDDAGEASWEAQRLRGALAKLKGFKAVEMNDEHGTVYLALPGTEIRRPEVLQSRAPGTERVPKWAANLPPAQQAALRKSGVIYDEKTVKQKINEMREGALKKLQYGIFDQFGAIKDQLGRIPYVLARMAKNADGTLEALMLYGRPRLDADGGMLVDTTKKGFVETMQGLNGEHERFFSWLAGRRAEQLKKEGRENLFTDGDISALSTLNQGKMKDGASREAVYLRAQKDVAELNKSVLDIAQSSGLIDAESRKVWASDFYVPFYRVMEEGVTGPSIKSGLVNQQSIKKLKGGTNNLGDLTQNMLMNWSTLLTASAKNRAAKASLDRATQIGAANESDEATIRSMGKSAQTKAVSYMEEGRNRWFVVEDDHLLAAISSLEFSGYNNAPMKVMSAFKNYLTMAVTSMPLFKVRNLIRDSVSSIAVAEAGYNPFANVTRGFNLMRDDDFRAQMVAGGGMYRFGTLMEGDRGAHVKKLIDAGVQDDTILDTAAKMKNFLGKLWNGYNEVGDLSENVNRAALYNKLRGEGVSHLEASFEARDLMDFGLSGAWAGVRALNQILPFFNARLQGGYKLVRGYNDDPRRMGTVIGAVALASVALMLAYKDDDDFKKRSEADRNNYWWFKVGETAYRIPKPFEIGAAGSAIEHFTALFFDSDNTNLKRFGHQMGDIVNAQLAMNPIPQVFRPLIDVYANKDAFTGRPIESMSMQRLKPEDRYTYNTSELARLLSKSGVFVDPVGLAAGNGVKQLSPVQIDSLIRGYFSGVGTLATAATDGLLRHTVIDRGESLPMTLKTFAGSFAETLPSNSSRYVDMLYTAAQKIDQSYASYQNAIKSGDLEKAREIMKEEGETIAKYHMVESLKKNEGKITQQIQRVTNSKDYTGEQKAAEIQRLKKLQDQIARQFEKQGN